MHTAPARALPTAAAQPSLRGTAAHLRRLLSSHVLVSVVGLGAMPFLARNLGSAGYGRFSLFLLGLGLLSSLDVARPNLVRELSRGRADDAHARELLSLTGASQLWLVPASLALGAWLFGLAAGAALALGVYFFVACAAPYATLAARDQVGWAGSVRNFAWAAAFAAATLISFADLPLHATLWPFALANVAIWQVLGRRAGGEAARLWRRPRWDVLLAQRARSLDVLGLALATAVVVSADKLLLEHDADEVTFGAYAAQYDLAVKLNLFSTALGTVLYPSLSRLYAERGLEVAARHLVRVLSWVTVAYFLGAALLIALDDRIVHLVLGPEIAAAARTYPWMLVGAFLALFGHVLTPWQRACGDFRTTRRAYAVSAVVMVLVGLVAVPRYGALGALAAYLSARSADVLLVTAEAVRLPRHVLPRRRLALLAAMVLGLALLAAAAGGAA